MEVPDLLVDDLREFFGRFRTDVAVDLEEGGNRNDRRAETAPLAVAWHLASPPRSGAAMAAALPL